MAVSKIHVRTSCSGHVHTSVHFRLSYAQMLQGAYFAIQVVSLRHAGHVLRDVPDKGRYLGSSGWGLGVGLTTSPRKNSTVLKPRHRSGHGPKTGRSDTEEDEDAKEEEEGGGGKGEEKGEEEEKEEEEEEEEEEGEEEEEEEEKEEKYEEEDEEEEEKDKEKEEEEE